VSARTVSRGEQGFALVEALVSLVIVGMICLMIIEGVGAGRRVWERIDQREAIGETIGGAQQSLRDRIEQVYPTTLFDTNPPNVDFHGARDGLVFVANPPQSSRPAPLRRYTLRVDTAGELVLSSVSDVDPTVISAAASQVLLTGVRALDLAYFGPAAPDQVRQWRTSWDQQPSPPELVRVRLNFEPGDTRHWPDLIVRPRATLDSFCLIDANTHRCRARP